MSQFDDDDKDENGEDRFGRYDRFGRHGKYDRYLRDLDVSPSTRCSPKKSAWWYGSANMSGRRSRACA
jgi:hypothetical protein